jgi:hypothetical protein
MSEALTWLIVAGIGLAALSIAAIAILKGWHGWLELKRFEYGGRRGSPAADRIEMADLKERIRKLEAIASCVDP